MKLGARILKTGIAIVLSLYLAQLVHSPSPVFAGIAAIFALQPTIYRSYLTIVEQIQGNLIGAVMAVVFVLLLGNHYVVIGLAAIIVILLALKLKLENTIALSLVTLISIMVNPGDDFIPFAGVRFSTIILGVFSAFIVNLAFVPPKYENKLYLKLSGTTDEIIRWIRLSTRHDVDHNLLKADIEKLKENVLKMEQFYLMYKEERSYFKKNDLEKSRKLVVFRQMNSTAKRGLDTLKRLHRYENELLHLPENLEQNIRQQLDCIIYHHEQLMLRYIGKVPTSHIPTEASICLNNKELFDLFVNYHQEDTNQPDHYHALQIISSIIDYGEQVEHLDTLISSFHSYHDNEVSIEKEDTL